jgi:hypothetical protein
VEGLLPGEIAPLSESNEKELIKVMMNEIIDRHAIDVNTFPHLDRCSGDHMFCDKVGTGTGMRIFAIGASHVTRIVGGLAECGLDVVNLAKPGWVLDDNTASELKNKLRNMNPGPEDIFLIDPLSNSVFCGTDPAGNHTDPVKIDERWHITGDLNVRTKSYLKNTLGLLKKIVDTSPDSKIILLTPVPRYVNCRCCNDPDHVQNFGEKGFQDEIAEDLDKVSDLLTAWLEARVVPCLLVDYRAATDAPSVPVCDLAIDEMSIWQPSDPVHPTPALYAKLAESIFSGLEDLEVTSAGSAPKRAGLESVVVRKSEKRGKSAISKQSWSLGILPAANSEQAANPRGCGSPRGWGGGRRGRGWHGGRIRGQFWAPRGAYGPPAKKY